MTKEVDTYKEEENSPIIIFGHNGTGKSFMMSELTIEQAKKTAYINTEDKKLPFYKVKPELYKTIREARIPAGNTFVQKFDTILNQALKNDEIENIIIDTFNKYASKLETCMEFMYPSNSFEKWANYQENIKSFFTRIKVSNKKIILMSHEGRRKENGLEDGRISLVEPLSELKGALKEKGIENEFNHCYRMIKIQLDDDNLEMRNLFKKSKLYKESKYELMKGEKSVLLINKHKSFCENWRLSNIKNVWGTWNDEDLGIDNNIMHILNNKKL